jgi:hypothetical protein
MGDSPALSVVQAADGTWCVKRGRKIIAEGLSNQQAWSRWDELDREANLMEETRRRISIATGQW